MNAMVAKETGRRVRRRRIFEVKEWDEEEEDGVERSGVWRWWLVIGMVAVVVGSNHQIGLHTQKQQQQVLCLFCESEESDDNESWMDEEVSHMWFYFFQFCLFLFGTKYFSSFFCVKKKYFSFLTKIS
jgi:hypothetical protein